MKSFAIVIACYKRLTGLKKLLASLERVDFGGRNDITLVFSIDYSGNKDVENYAESYKWAFGPKRIRAFTENQGLKKHILSCGDLSEEYDIAVRGGFHCAPKMHEYLGTTEEGLVRISLATGNTSREIDRFLSAVKRIAGDPNPRIM